MPTFYRPAGLPLHLRALNDALHALRERAGLPSARDISAAILHDASLPATASHERVRSAFSKPSLPRWDLIHALVSVIGPQAGRKTEEELERFRALWLSALSESKGESGLSAPTILDPASDQQLTTGDARLASKQAKERTGPFSKLSVLQRLGEPTSARLLQLGSPEIYENGKALMRAGNTSEFVALLLRGYVKVASADHMGATVILDFGIPGNFFGENAAITGEILRTDIIAVEEVYVRRITTAEFSQFLGDHPSAMREVLVSTNRQLAHSQLQRTQSWKPQAVARVATRLDYLVDICGIRTPTGWRIGIPLSQDELAQFIPMGRTMVLQALDRLRKTGVVANSRRMITVIDREALRVISEQGVT